MPSPSLSGTPTTGAGHGSTFTITPPAGLAATDRTWVLMVHDNAQFGFDAVDEDDAAVSLVQSSFQASMSLRLIRFDAFDDVSRTGSFFSGSPDNPVSVDYAWVAFALARDAGAPSVPVSRDAYGAAATASSTGPVTTPDITPTVDNALIVDVIGWSRGTTMTPPAGSTELGEARSGDTAADRSIWVGYRTVIGGADTVLPGITVTNDNPFAHSAAAFSTLTLAFVVDTPPTEWQIDIASGLPGNLFQYSAADRQADPGFGPIPRIEVLTDDPPAGLTHYARMQTHDDDIAPLTANNNPRTQLTSPQYMLPGDTRFMDWWLRFPEDFPSIPYGAGNYLAVAQIHGPAYTYSPTVALFAHGDSVDLVLRDYGGEIPSGASAQVTTVWKHPLVRGRWMHFCWRVRLVNDLTGYVDFWFDGRRQRLGDGRTARAYRRTINIDQVQQLHLAISNYRSKGTIPGVVTFDQAGMRFSDRPPPEIDLAPPVASAARVV